MVYQIVIVLLGIVSYKDILKNLAINLNYKTLKSSIPGICGSVWSCFAASQYVFPTSVIFEGKIIGRNCLTKIPFSNNDLCMLHL